MIKLFFEIVASMVIVYGIFSVAYHFFRGAVREYRRTGNERTCDHNAEL